MKRLVILSMLLGNTLLYGQNTINNASGTQLITTGSLNVVIRDMDIVNDGVLSDASGTVDVGGSATQITGTGTTELHNVVVNSDVSLGKDISVTGDFTNNHTITGGNKIELNGSALQLVTGTGTISNAEIDNSAGVAIASGNVQSLTGTLILSNGTLATNGGLVLKSSAGATARIGQVTGTGSISGDVTVERFIPSKVYRKYSLVTAPVVQLISQAWQQQVHITGAGSGGTACADALAVNQPTQHTNGFDATGTNAPSMFYYDETVAPTAPWIPITGTNSTSLSPGKGYRMNIRGSRSLGCSLLGTATPPSPPDVVLSATGAVVTGDLPLNVTGAATGAAYTLLGNPYPCELDFTAFRSDISNSGVISNTYWCYDPQRRLSNNTYSVFNNGIGVNFPASYPSPEIIASGQAFFVEKTTAGAGIVTFKEAHKSMVSQKGMFKTTTPTDIVRIGLKQSDTTHIDEIVIRFNTNGSFNYDPEWDAHSLNSGTRITSLKSGNHLAIHTRPEVSANDTVKLNVQSTSTGSFLLAFSDHGQFNGNIYLLDYYTNNIQLVNLNPYYSFNVTNDPLTQGAARFILIFSNSPLSSNEISITAIEKDSKVEVAWSANKEIVIDHFEVERSSDGRSFQNQVTVPSSSSNQSPVYHWIDNNPQYYNYYRVKGLTNDNRHVYSKIVLLRIGDIMNGSMVVYPNPVRSQLNIDLANLPAGAYDINLYNDQGALVFRQAIEYSGGSSSLKLNLPASLSNGHYNLNLKGPKELFQTILINK